MKVKHPRKACFGILPNGSKLLTEGHGLNVCVPSEFSHQSSKPQGDRIWRWGLWGWPRFRGGGGDVRFLIARGREAGVSQRGLARAPSPGRPVRTQQQKAASDSPSHQNRTAGTLVLGFSASRTSRAEQVSVVQAAPSVAFCPAAGADRSAGLGTGSDLELRPSPRTHEPACVGGGKGPLPSLH